MVLDLYHTVCIEEIFYAMFAVIFIDIWLGEIFCCPYERFGDIFDDNVCSF